MNVRNQFFLLVLWFIGFCERVYTKAYNTLDYLANRKLEGKVLYLALYTKDDNYYATLYDFTSLYNRLYLVLMSLIYYDYLKKMRIFNIKDAVENFTNTAHVVIDVGVVSYIQDGKLAHKLLIEESKSSKAEHHHPFLYAIVEDSNGREINLSSLFTQHPELVASTFFDCKDVVSIFTNRLNQPLSSNEFKLRLMSEITYEEHIFKANDNIISIIGKDE